MEAYGAAYALQEFLTVKSDDVHGSNQDVRSHRQGRLHPGGGFPESFNVLIKELQSSA